jgi:hypothetical protein
VQSFTDPEVWYEIFLSADGEVAKCTCKAFAKRGKEQECKHAKLLRSHLAAQQNGHRQRENPQPEDDASSLAPSEDELEACVALRRGAAQHRQQPAETKASAVRDLLQPWLVVIQGKETVKAAGLVHLAHQRGLKSIDVQLTHVSEKLACASATVTFRDGRIFSEIGDACPANTNEKVRPHFVRCAATRAVVRALRWALDVADLVALEELEA